MHVKKNYSEGGVKKTKRKIREGGGDSVKAAPSELLATSGKGRSQRGGQRRNGVEKEGGRPGWGGVHFGQSLGGRAIRTGRRTWGTLDM